MNVAKFHFLIFLFECMPIDVCACGNVCACRFRGGGKVKNTLYRKVVWDGMRRERWEWRENGVEGLHLALKY